MAYIIRKVSAEDYDAIYELWNSTEQSRRALNPVDDSREGIARYLKGIRTPVLRQRRKDASSA